MIFWQSSVAFYSENQLSKPPFLFYMDTEILTIFLKFGRIILGKVSVD